MASKNNKPKTDEAPVVVFNLDELTYGELETFEQVVGFVPASEEDMGSIPKITMTIAIVTIMEQRKDPTVTVDDIRNAPIGKYDMSGEVQVNPDKETKEGGDE